MDRSPLGAYGRRARLTPSLLALLPVAVLAFTAGWATDRALFGAIIAVGVEAGVPFLLGNMPRRRGQLVQQRLWADTPLPATRMLRRRDSSNLHLVEAAHAGLAKLCPEVHLPTASEERSFPADADARYAAAVTTAGGIIRNSPAGALLFEENCAYGFHRNLRGISDIGKRISAVAAAISAGTLVLALVGTVGANPWLLAAGLAGQLGWLVFWNVYPTDARVLASGEDYANAFIRAAAAPPTRTSV